MDVEGNKIYLALDFPQCAEKTKVVVLSPLCTLYWHSLKLVSDWKKNYAPIILYILQNPFMFSNITPVRPLLAKVLLL